MRLAVAEWLQQTPGLTVCGQADSPTTALAAITRSRPDIVVTEIFCPEDMNFIQELHKRHPDLPILVYSNGNEKWYAPRALEAGADGYVLKGLDANGLIDAIQRILEGRVVLSENMRYRLLVKCLRRKRPGAAMQIAWRRALATRKLHPSPGIGRSGYVS